MLMMEIVHHECFLVNFSGLIILMSTIFSVGWCKWLKRARILAIAWRPVFDWGIPRGTVLIQGRHWYIKWILPVAPLLHIIIRIYCIQYIPFGPGLHVALKKYSVLSFIKDTCIIFFCHCKLSLLECTDTSSFVLPCWWCQVRTLNIIEILKL